MVQEVEESFSSSIPTVLEYDIEPPTVPDVQVGTLHSSLSPFGV